MLKRITPLIWGWLIIYITGCATSMQIIGHRGASFMAPENTLSAVKLAWEMGADAVEIDVWLSKDKRVIVSHDASTKRTADIDLNISETSSTELRKLDVGRWKGEQFAGEKMPFLEEIIETIPPGRQLFIEIKCGAEILPYLREIIQNSGRQSQIVIIGFDLETLTQSKALMPDIPTYWLRSTVKDEQTQQPKPHNPEWIILAKQKNLDGLNVHYAGLTKDFATAVHGAGLKLYVWTANDPADALRLKKLRVNGITTDKPDIIRAALFKKTKEPF